MLTDAPRAWHPRRIDPVLITTATPSLADQRARVRRLHGVMALGYGLGFGLGYPVSLWQGWAGAAVLVAGCVAPWLAAPFLRRPVVPGERVTRRPVAPVVPQAPST